MPVCPACLLLLTMAALIVPAIILLAAGCVSAPQQPVLVLAPPVVTSGDPVSIAVTGLSPGEKVRIEAVQQVRNGTLRSYAVFAADGVTRVPVDEAGIRGVFFLPARSEPSTAMISLALA